MYRIYTIIALVVLSLIQFGCYSNMKKDRDSIEAKTVQKYEQEILDEKEKQRIALERLNEELFIVSSDLEAERNNIKIEFRDIRHETQKIITDRIYTECKLTDDGLRIANKAIDSANTSKPDD